MKKLIGLIAISAMAATFAGCNSADRASAQGKEVKVAGQSCSESKASTCCSTDKVAMAKASTGTCSDKAASCSDKEAMAKSAGSCADKAASCGDKSAATKSN